jgi:decaprenyl-phosphate phosphoribosyltransferase
MVIALRPKQWIKNLLVIAAPIAAREFSPQVGNVMIGFIGFSAASSFGYLINDWNDRKVDMHHPKKGLRPFASGLLNFYHLILLASLCITIALATCILLPINFTLTLLMYLVLTISYSWGIKSIPVFEMLWLATGFLLRALAGSAIIQSPPTGWFIVTVLFGALFIVSLKRLAELKIRSSKVTRKVIESYSKSFLGTVVTSSLTITLLTYALWIFEVYSNSLLAQVTILPFSLSCFLYTWHSENGDAESPESLIMSSKIMVLSIVATILPLLIVMHV